MIEPTIQEWIYLEINDDLRVSVKIYFPEGTELTCEDKEALARYKYMKMTFSQVTKVAA